MPQNHRVNSTRLRAETPGDSQGIPRGFSWGDPRDIPREMWDLVAAKMRPSGMEEKMQHPVTPTTQGPAG